MKHMYPDLVLSFVQDQGFGNEGSSVKPFLASDLIGQGGSFGLLPFLIPVAAFD